MFGISSTEYLLIAIVALVVIGPKELPAVMRTMGQWTRKVRGMAAEFQNQFQEAMREAEMADLKKQVDDMARDVKDIDPLKGVRDDIEGIGKDVERSVASSTTEQPPALLPSGSEPMTEAAAALAEPASVSAAAAPASPPAETVERAEQADGTGTPG